MRKERKHFTPEEKVAILRRHLVDKESDVEVILQRAKEKYPEAKPRIVSDNGRSGITFSSREIPESAHVSYPPMPHQQHPVVVIAPPMFQLLETKIFR